MGGRLSGPPLKPANRRSGRNRYTGGPPPAGGPGWIWMTADLIGSPAWQKRPIHVVRLIDFLLQEHLRKSGNENGRLKAPHRQLITRAGIGSQYVAKAIRDAEDLGLIVVKHGAAKGRAMNENNLFRLTFLPTRDRGDDGAYWEWKHPTDDWQHFEMERDAAE